MYLGEEYVITQHTRISKLGAQHVYQRKKTLILFRCDSCKELFKREKGKMSPKRLSNNYFHCCTACDSKRFAQRKGAERRTIWDRPASSLDNIGDL